jgi:hypothetical protein
MTDARKAYNAALLAAEAAHVTYAAAERRAAMVCEDNADAALMHDCEGTPETEAAADAADEAAYHATVALRKAERALKRAQADVQKAKDNL